MRLRSLVLFSALALAPSAAILAQDEPKEEPKKDAPDDKKDKPDEKKDKPDESKKPEKEKVDVDEGKVLEKKVHVPTGWNAAKHSVDMTYDFSDRNMKKEWKFDGMERAVVGNEPDAKAEHMELGVSSGGKGMALLDAFELAGDFTVIFSVKVQFRSPSSQLCLVLGAKDGNAIGLRWGDQVVKLLKGGRMAPVTKNDPAELEFTGARLVEIKAIRTGDDLQVFVQGDERPKVRMKKKELDGKIGIYLDNNMRVEVQSVKIQGVVGKVKP